MLRTILEIVRALVNTQPVLVRDAVYSKKQIDQMFGENQRRWAKWKLAGLRPLATATNAEYFDSNEMIDLWKSMREEQTE